MTRSLQIICGLLLTATAVTAAPRPAMPPLRVVGNQVMAGKQPLHLRGINWGWWKLSGTRYEEADMRNLAGWGANFARLAFSAEMLENEERPGTWNEAGFHDLDAVVQWGRRYGVYVALDMHVIPGGQNTSHYTAGGKNQFWKDPACQERFLALWRELARRYKNHPEVAAYELMNEPETAGKITPEELRALYQRAIAAIRAVDPDKIIVAPGDHYSGADSLTDALALPERNILYTFHFYNPSQLTHQSPPPGIGYPSDAAFAADVKWLRNVKDGSGINGTRDWVRLEERFTPGADVTAMGFMLRSSNNSGSAWFDEVRLETADGKTLFAESFDQGKSAFQPERFPESAMSFDAQTGHLKPGSLKVHGTPDYNGWTGPMMPVEPGKQYVLSAWVKLENATGDTYPSMALFGGATKRVDKEYLRAKLAPAIAFARKHNVPVWVGEFGCAAAARPEGSQTRWTRDCISLFEDAGLHWTYWNYKETTRPGSMALSPLAEKGDSYAINTDLLATLKEGWKLNRRTP